MVLAADQTPVVNLVPPKESTKPQPTLSTESYQPTGPSFYVNNIKLPVKPEQLGKELTAKIKLVPTSISQRDTSKRGSKTSYDFEIKSIQFV